VIASTRAAIAKAQALIHDEQKLANEKKKVEELEAAKSRVQVHTSKLGALQTQLAVEKVLSDEKLRVQGLVEVEEALQRDI